MCACVYACVSMCVCLSAYCVMYVQEAALVFGCLCVVKVWTEAGD